MENSRSSLCLHLSQSHLIWPPKSKFEWVLQEIAVLCIAIVIIVQEQSFHIHDVIVIISLYASGIASQHKVSLVH